MELQKIIIADDHPSFGQGLEHSILQLFPSAKIHFAGNVNRVVEILETEPIDLIFMDIHLNKQEGMEIIKRLRQSYKNLKITSIITLDEFAVIGKLFQAGANGCIHRICEKPLLVELFRELSRDSCYVSDELMEKRMNNSPQAHKSLNSKIHPVELSEREIEIMILLCNQYSSQEIAQLLHLPKESIENFRNQLFFKTQAKNIAGLSMFAIQYGYFLSEHKKHE